MDSLHRGIIAYSSWTARDRGRHIRWGGTLTLPIEVIYEIDTWGEAARASGSEKHEELAVRLGTIEAELWEISRTTQKRHTWKT